MTRKQALDTIGGFSSNSKMPELTTGTSTNHCNVGSKLALIPGTVCHGCYAVKGAKRFPAAINGARMRRQDAIDKPEWVEAMVLLIDGTNHFRWSDSGDLLDMAHLVKIVAIAQKLPKVRFWLPTKEYGLIRQFVSSNTFPSNLIVRVSAPMLNTAPTIISGTLGSAVHTKDHAPTGTVCEAYTRGGKCGDCRKCWNKRYKVISYPKH
jgi:hypothetical protein